jgi:hypothetical protein
MRRKVTRPVTASISYFGCLSKRFKISAGIPIVTNAPNAGVIISGIIIIVVGVESGFYNLIP